MDLKFSKYVHSFLDENKYIMYNSLNGSIVSLEKEKCLNIDKLNKSEIDFLNNANFFIDDDKAKELIIKSYNNFISDSLEIIIEITKKCNLKCVYCYQNNFKQISIEFKQMDNIIEYIENCLKKNIYKKLQISFIGGEPLLEKNKIKYIYNKLRDIEEKYKIILLISIETNGLLLEKNFIEHFKNIHLSIPLSNALDHNSKRFAKNKDDTFDIILFNLLCIQNSCKNYTLNIRYNVDHNSITQFKEFIDNLKNLELNFSIEISYTYEHTHNIYKNFLSFTEFKNWNSTEAIDILIENDLRIKQKPSIMLHPCYGYFGKNIKIFADGLIGLCNADYIRNSNIYINEIKDSPEIVENFITKNKKLEKNNLCLNCREYPLCGGDIFCREKICQYSNINLGKFLKTFLKYGNIKNNTKALKLFDFYKM